NSKTEDVPEYCIVYGQNDEGERNFYRYDQKEMTMQRYFRDPDAADLRAKYTELAETYTELLAEYKTRGWIIAVLAGVSVLLAVLLVVSLIVRKPKKAAAEEKEVKEFIPTERRKAAKAEKIEKVETAAVPVVETEDEIEEIEIEEAEEDDDFEFIDLDL
ncbi:MAG: hypothetical protein II327_02940, partial [Lachnospiraceae bacterium]|nr:hypothetical protein [Lachnospiraceae bacterium]